VHNQETSSSWIEPVLARHLGRTTAPAELWQRVAEPRMPRPASANFRLLLALASVLFVALLLGGFHPGRTPVLDFRSSRPDQIQAWVKANTGLDVPLHASHSVRLLGASAIRGRDPAARIIYRAGAKDIALTVASAGVAPVLAVSKNDSVFSWTARGQKYVVACADAEELRIGCLLCHAGA
jgi:hypothetical protein